MIKLIAILLPALFVFASTQGQKSTLTQTIRGIVTDAASGHPIPYATITPVDLPATGTVADSLGRFVLKDIPIGRHSVQATSMGYSSHLLPEILLTSARETYLEINLKENIHELEEVVVRAHPDKTQPMNKMALSGAYLLSVEDANRYAGGMDDPARLVSSFAGVSAGTSTNGISVHGNAPNLLQWRLEDVEIPNPNHFADIASLGGGILSSLSSHVLGNSDFFTGAFPAEYGNAISGVFDMKLRNGNNQKNENTFQVGVLGMDFASEGPLSRHHKASYLFNYRYSTTGLMSKINPAQKLGGTLDYQDLNFKLNFPTRKAGTFSMWGTGFIDKFSNDMKEPEEWIYPDENQKSESHQNMAAGGINHRYFFNNGSLLKTTVAATYLQYKAWEDNYDSQLEHSSPWARLNNRNTNLVLTSSLNHKFNAGFTNKTGFTVTGIFYNTKLDLAPYQTQALETVAQGNGRTVRISAYNISSVRLNERLTLNAGLTGQILTLNNHWTLEPRAGIKWLANQDMSLAFAYGLHSRMEKMDVYLVNTPDKNNKDLDFTKAHHLLLTYDYKFTEHLHLKIEPYLQFLFHVPVIADSSWSVLNRKEVYIDELLVNRGKGTNYGVDITFMKSLSKGIYYMFTGSVFESRYCGGDRQWHSTRFNRNYIFNVLGGKEWMIGRNRQDILSLNLKFTLQGGDRYSPVNRETTLSHPDYEVQYDESNAYSEQFSPALISSYTFSYKMNRRKISHEFAIKAINASDYKEYYGHKYNLSTGNIEPEKHATSLTNISYKLEF